MLSAVLAASAFFAACENRGDTDAETQIVAYSEEASAETVSEQTAETEKIQSETEITEQETHMPDPLIMDGIAATLYCTPTNTRVFDEIPVELMELRDNDEVTLWVNSDALVSKFSAPTSIEDYVNVYSFVKRFNITKDEAETALEAYIGSNNWQTGITRGEFDVLFSDDAALITKTFATECSIVIGDKVYCPEWVYIHSAAEYEQVGITVGDIEEKAKFYSVLFFRDEARAAFEKKLFDYAGREISLEYDDQAAHILTELP